MLAGSDGCSSVDALTAHADASSCDWQVHGGDSCAAGRAFAHGVFVQDLLVTAAVRGMFNSLIA